VPSSAAQIALQMVKQSGIKAVLNFAPVPLKSGPDIKVNSIDLTTSLENLSYFLAKSDDAKEG